MVMSPLTCPSDTLSHKGRGDVIPLSFGHPLPQGARGCNTPVLRTPSPTRGEGINKKLTILRIYNFQLCFKFKFYPLAKREGLLDHNISKSIYT